VNGSRRVWLFRCLVIVSAGFLLLTWFLPWWSAYTTAAGDNSFVIHPYGLDISEQMLFYKTFIPDIEMPGYFTPLMWLYLGLVVVALLIGAWLKDKSIGLFRRRFNLSRWLIGIVGFSYVVVVILAVIVASIRTSDFGMTHFLGGNYVSYGWKAESYVEGQLLLGYWLACAVGPLLIVLALLRNRIIGKA
jgi:hypothetical protein